MKTISYCTALWYRQGYCQKERIDCFNAAAKAAAENGLVLHNQLYINNSDKSFYREMRQLYKRKAEFPYIIKNLGKLEYWTNHNMIKGWSVVGEHGKHTPTESWKDGQFADLQHFDIFQLLARVFNLGMRTSINMGHDYFCVVSGDQLLPESHPSVMTRFLETHPNAGIASSLTFFDFSKRVIIDGESEKTYVIPLIIFRAREGETEAEMEQRKKWVFANLLPHPENNYTGMEYCEVDALGSGGAVIPRRVFSKLKFEDGPFAGEGEDVRYCLDIREKLGLKVYIIPTVVMENRYADGKKY